jgi:hypothetical protein
MVHLKEMIVLTANSESKSRNYPCKFENVSKQIELLKQFFCGLDYANERIAKKYLPEGAEGYFAIPRFEKIASTYCEAVQRVIDLIKQVYNNSSNNYREENFDPLILCQSEKKVQAFQQISQEQKSCDIFIVPAQFGSRYAGLSMGSVRAEMSDNEFGLGVYEIGIMLLTTPNRLCNNNSLLVDCIGDSLLLHSIGLNPSPNFGFYDGKIIFGMNYPGIAASEYGSVTGFVQVPK